VGGDPAEAFVKIQGVHSLVYGCSDLEPARHFFRDLGLEETEDEAPGTSHQFADGTSVVLRPIEDNNLPSAPTGGDTVREIIWRVDSSETLQKIGAEISKDRHVTESSDGSLHSFDDLGYALGFAVAEIRPINLVPAITNTLGNRPRRNRRGDATQVLSPKLQRIAHVGLWSPGEVDANKEFYVDRLGFRETDYIKDIGVFLRAEGSNEHHDVFLSRRGSRSGFQHVACEVKDFDEVLFLGTRLEQKGWETHFGPGRHIFGSNVFWYFWNPAGGLLEITADLDYIDDDWEMGYHESLPKGAGTWLARPIDLERTPFRTRDEDFIIE
jgi:catechol 2,3-dioxygenase-like lactoylglutathione lyase family enzyme